MSDAPAQAVEQAYARYMRAMTSQEHETVLEILHERFESTDPLGVVRDRDGYLELARTEVGPGLRAELLDLEVRCYGDVAATTCVYSMAGAYQSGYSPPRPIRVTGSWVLEDGAWRFFSQQGCYIA